MANMRGTYFLCEVRVRARSCFVIWYSSSRDGILRNRDGKIRRFSNATSAYGFAHRRDLVIRLNEGTSFYDFESLSRWCINPNITEIQCSSFLNTWNLLEDALGECSKSEFRVVSRQMDEVYKKLFKGCNIPAVTRGNSFTIPVWTLSESITLSVLFSLGISEFENLLEVAFGAET